MKRDEGDGNADGIAVSLDMIGDGVYEVYALHSLPWLHSHVVFTSPHSSYVVTASVGQGAQQLSLQVDTGSSDLVRPSQSCRDDLAQ